MVMTGGEDGPSDGARRRKGGAEMGDRRGLDGEEVSLAGRAAVATVEGERSSADRAVVEERSSTDRAAVKERSDFAEQGVRRAGEVAGGGFYRRGEIVAGGGARRKAELVGKRSSSGGSAGRREARSRTGGADRERVNLEGAARRHAVVVEGVVGEVVDADTVGRRDEIEPASGSEFASRESVLPASGTRRHAVVVDGCRERVFGEIRSGLVPELSKDKQLARRSLGVVNECGAVEEGESSSGLAFCGLEKRCSSKPVDSFGVIGERSSSGAFGGGSSVLTFFGPEKRCSSKPVGTLGVIEEGSSSGFFGEFGISDQRRSSSVAARVAVLHRGEETIELGVGYRGLCWSSEGGLVDGFVAADFDEHGSNLSKEVGLVMESDVVVDDGEEIIETGSGSLGGLSMRDRLAAASKLVIDKETVDEISSSSDSSSSESSSDSSSESGSVLSLSGTGNSFFDRVVGGEREDVDDHVISRVAGSLSDPTSSCSSDGEPVSRSLGEDVMEVNLDESAVLEQNQQDGEDIGFVDERVGANGGGDEDTAASGEYGGVSTGEFSEVKGESFDFSYPSYADYSSTIDLVDGEMEQKTKKPRKKSCRMGPFLDHPRDSKSSTVMASRLEWITASCCTEGAVEVRLPGLDERPWTVPDGWVCLYDFWFLEYHLWFPLPRLLLAYCDERRIALSQLTPGSIRNVVGALVLAAECGVHMSLYFLEEIIKITPGETYGTFYLFMKSGRCFFKEERRKTFDWIRRFFYVRITPSSVSNMSRPLMTSWNPYYDRHTVGVPFAPEYKECLAYVETTWEVCSRMDFSEFPSLSECFAGGNAANAAAVVSESLGASVGVGASLSVPGVVVGLASAPASFAQSADCRREGRGASEKSVAVGGKKGGDPKKRPADGSLAKEASSSKLRKVAVTTKDAPPPSGAPLVGGVSVVDGGEVVFQPFECAFGGTVEDCRELFKKLRMVDNDEGCPLDTSERSEWYIKYARHTIIAAKYVNRLVNSQEAELKVVAAELEKANIKLATAKGGADRTGEIAAWRRKYEAERKISFAAQEEVKALTTRMAVDC
ncbi:hypothetical protein N665_0308s0030 [Sinapis alba]|nr:hypothetical protein N665_0308s0030 [Sinapis alba]